MKEVSKFFEQLFCIYRFIVTKLQETQFVKSNKQLFCIHKFIRLTTKDEIFELCLKCSKKKLTNI